MPVSSWRVSVSISAVLSLCLLLPNASAYATQPPASSFATAASCPSSTVGKIARLQLPYSNVEAWSAKVFDKQTKALRSIALLGDGTIADRASLLNNELVARKAQLGKIHPSLNSQLRTMGDTDAVNVHIWTAARLENSRREDLVSKSAQLAYQATANAEFAAASYPITSWLQANGIATFTTSNFAPFLSASLTKAQLMRLASLDSVTEIAPIPSARPLSCGPWPVTTAWYDTSKIAAARSGPGNSSAKICMVDAGAPTDTTWLRISSTRVPTQQACHSQAVAGILSNTFPGNTTSVTDAQIVSTSEDLIDNPYMLGGMGTFEY